MSDKKLNQLKLINQRNSIMNNSGFIVRVESSEGSKYKYTIAPNSVSLEYFRVEIYRDVKDEIDSLLQTILYLDSTPHKISLAEISAYQFCLDTISSDPAHPANFIIRKKIKETESAEYIKTKLPDVGIAGIDSFHCSNIQELEHSKEGLFQLYVDLLNLKQAAEQLGIDYESLIFDPAEPSGLAK